MAQAGLYDSIMQRAASIARCISEDGRGGWGSKEWGRRGRMREALWKGSRLQREWGQQGGGWRAPLLHWPNATAAAAVKRGLPFFPRPGKRAQTVAQARQGQVTALIYTLGLCAHNADTQLIYSMCADRHVRTQPHPDQDREGASKDPDTNFDHIEAIV